MIAMKLDIKDHHILVAGFAQLPKGTPVYELQKSIGCIMVIDMEKEVIEEVSFTFLKDLTNEFISGLIKGRSIKNGMDEIVQIIENRFIVPPQRAVIQAVLIAYNRYRELHPMT
jgi:Domain of unknown function (DUF3870)